MELSTDFSENLEKLEEELNKAIDFLNKLDSPSKIFNGTIGFNYFIFIGKAIFYSYKYDIDFEIFIKKKFEKFLVNLMEYLYKINKQLDFGVKIDAHNPQQTLVTNEKCILGLSFGLYITNILIKISNEFCVNFLIKNGLRAHLLFINDKDFVQKNQVTTISLLSGDFNLIDQFILNISIMCKKTCDEYKWLWSYLDSVNILLNISKNKESAWFLAYISIADIANDKQIDEISDFHNILLKTTTLLQECKNDFNLNSFNRSKLEIIFNGRTINCEVHNVKDVKYTNFYALKDLIVCLYKFSLNEKIKPRLYFGYDLKSCLKILIKKGNYIEMYYSLALLAQLSFNEIIANDIRNDYELISFFNNLYDKDLGEIKYNNEKFIYQSIKNLIIKIKWNLSEKWVCLPQTQKEQIMISYNAANREVCIKIKEKLESFGHKVWMDVNDLHSSNVEIMAKAVENSICILMCVSERYRQSINCQVEARYAFKLNKPIIALLLQSGYEEVNGWIGAIMNDKIFVNFVKNSFDESIQKLNNIILESDKEVLSCKIYKNNVEEWTESNVREWFIKAGLNIALLENLELSSGLRLKNIYQIRNASIEFFFQILNEIKDVNSNDAFQFSNCLEKLFN